MFSFCTVHDFYMWIFGERDGELMSVTFGNYEETSMFLYSVYTENCTIMTLTSSSLNILANYIEENIIPTSTCHLLISK